MKLPALRTGNRVIRLDASAVQRWLPAVIALAAIAVYVNSLWNGFAYDDVYIIEKNLNAHDLSAWRDIWLTPYWPYHGTELGIYRPFIIFFYAVQWAISGGQPWFFHTVNVLLHATVSVLAFYLLQRLTTRVPALVGALIFAVHPLHTEVVANVVGQAELVTATAMLGACLIHVTRPAGTAVSWPGRLALVALFAVALTTKESSVVLPGLLVALDFAQQRVRISVRGVAQYADDMLMTVVLLGATLAAYLIVRFDVMSGSLIGVDAAPSMPYLREPHRVLNALRAFPEFVRLLFFPLDLSADYAPGVILAVDSLTMMTLLGAALLLGLIALALVTPWWPMVGLAAAWFLISIIVVSNLLFPIGVLIAERTLYLPSFAVSLIAASAWQTAQPRASLAVRRIVPVLTLIVLILLGVRTWTRNPDWADTPAVLRALSRDHPESYKTQWTQALILWRQGDLGQAALRFGLAERIYPRDAQFLVEYGTFLLRTGRRPEARALFERSYRMRSDDPRTAFMLAYTNALEGRNHEALRLLAEAERLDLSRMISMPLRAQIYHAFGDHNKAVAAMSVTLAYSGKAMVAWAFVSRTLAIAGYEVEALDAVDRGLTLAKDTTNRRRLGQLRTVIEDGCYRGLFDREPTASGIFAMPACDPLGDFYRIAIRHAEIATTLQNASLPDPNDLVWEPFGDSQANTLQ